MAVSHKKRTYGQTCLLARALDVIGERWTLLVVRELLSGPKRFTELHAALEGMGTNLLADRLKELTTLLVIERTPNSTRTRPVYRLTGLGEGLRPVLKELFSWGATGGASPEATDSKRVSASRVFALFFKANERPEWRATVEMRIPGDTFQLHFQGGSVEVTDRGSQRPRLTIVTKGKSWNRVASGRSTFAQEIAKRNIRFDGSDEDFQNFCAVFGLDPTDE